MKVSFLIKIFEDQKKHIWFLPGEGPVRNSKVNFDQFINSRTNLKLETIQLLGSHTNSHSIIKLFILKIKGCLDNIQICTPSIVSTNLASAKPEHALLAMNKIVGWPASIGGWHDVGEHDYVTFSLINSLQKHGYNDNAFRFLKDHPIFYPISYIPHISHQNLAWLLSLIIDPRWYINPEKPDKCSRLESYLGLNPKTQRCVSGDDCMDRLSARCNLVLSTWKNGSPEFGLPNNFLWRIWKHHGQDYMADLRTSQNFIAFLRLLWLNELRQSLTESLFIPSYFFHRQDEIISFEQYMEQK